MNNTELEMLEIDEIVRLVREIRALSSEGNKLASSECIDDSEELEMRYVEEMTVIYRLAGKILKHLFVDPS